MTKYLIVADDTLGDTLYALVSSETWEAFEEQTRLGRYYTPGQVWDALAERLWTVDQYERILENRDPHEDVVAFFNCIEMVQFLRQHDIEVVGGWG